MSRYEHFECVICDRSYTEYHDSYECEICQSYICENCSTDVTYAKTQTGKEVLVCNECKTPTHFTQDDKNTMLNYLMKLYDLDWNDIYQKATGIKSKSKLQHMIDKFGWKEFIKV